MQQNFRTAERLFCAVRICDTSSGVRMSRRHEDRGERGDLVR